MGGALALDLANTVDWSADGSHHLPERTDVLDDPDRALRWGRRLGLVASSATPALDEAESSGGCAVCATRRTACSPTSPAGARRTPLTWRCWPPASARRPRAHSWPPAPRTASTGTPTIRVACAWSAPPTPSACSVTPSGWHASRAARGATAAGSSSTPAAVAAGAPCAPAAAARRCAATAPASARSTARHATPTTSWGRGIGAGPARRDRHVGRPGAQAGHDVRSTCSTDEDTTANHGAQREGRRCPAAALRRAVRGRGPASGRAHGVLGVRGGGELVAAGSPAAQAVAAAKGGRAWRRPHADRARPGVRRRAAAQPRPPRARRAPGRRVLVRRHGLRAPAHRPRAPAAGRLRGRPRHVARRPLRRRGRRAADRARRLHAHGGPHGRGPAACRPARARSRGARAGPSSTRSPTPCPARPTRPAPRAGWRWRRWNGRACRPCPSPATRASGTAESRLRVALRLDLPLDDAEAVRATVQVRSLDDPTSSPTPPSCGRSPTTASARGRSSTP